ncbi:MAG: transposase [Burkholderiaceae bacterium]|jgi:putative transposase|nr:transposase [Burkholderiaceae bacterium]
MARTARLLVLQQPHHILQKGNNGRPLFKETADYSFFLDCAHKAAEQYGVAIHAYTLLPDRLHLVASPMQAATGIARMMQWIGRRYVPCFNRKYGYTGTLWEGRYKTTLIEAQTCLLRCICFIETLPVREGLAATPADYLWSSYTHHAGLRQNPLVHDHTLYWELGNTPFAREAAYNRLMHDPFSPTEAEEIQRVLNNGWLMGSAAYQREIEALTGRKWHMGKRGRPPKRADTAP